MKTFHERTMNHLFGKNGWIGLAAAILLSVFSQAGQAQTVPSSIGDTIFLEGFISGNKVLAGNKVYVLRHNVKVSNTAILTIEPNAVILFGPKTSLVVEGGLQMNGKPNNFITATSLDTKDQGIGIVVRGSTPQGDISITYTRFSGLNTVLSFDFDWYREKVTVEDNIFRDFDTGESNILITSPLTTYQNTSDRKTTFSFSRNDFINNWGTVYVENFQDNILDLRLNNNLFTNNVVKGIDKGIPSNSPIFGFFDNENKRYLTQIQENSVFGNYQINAATDTIIREISVGIQGEGEAFPIPSNFFRSYSPNYVSATFDHFYQNNELPLLLPDPILKEPSSVTHGHIYKVEIEDEEILNYDLLPDMGARNVPFKVFFNRPVTEVENMHLESVWYDTTNNEIRVTPISITNGTFSADNKVFYFTVDNATMLRNQLGYIVINNFKDYEGFEVPDFTIGQPSAINHYGRLYYQGVENTYIPATQVISDKGSFTADQNSIATLESLNELGDLSYLGAYTSLAKTFEVGIQAGTANYMGEMAFRFLDTDQYRWGFGLYGQYNISKWFSGKLGFNYARIAGEDVTDPDLGRRTRLANFRSEIFELSATVQFHLLQYGISKGEKFSPFIYAGVGLFYFDPKARIYVGLDENGDPDWYTDANGNDVWFQLQPVGTEGQTAQGPDAEFPNRTAPKKYKRIQVAIPLGVGVDFIINKSWTIGADLGFRFTSTDYLDDVSGYYYDSNRDEPNERPFDAIVDANPTIKGKAKGNSVEISTVTITNPDGTQSTYDAAALLAAPSLITTSTDSGDYDAESFPDARRGEVNRDWYMLVGLKASKIIGYNRYRKKAEKAVEQIIEF